MKTKRVNFFWNTLYMPFESQTHNGRGNVKEFGFWNMLESTKRRRATEWKTYEQTLPIKCGVNICRSMLNANGEAGRQSDVYQRQDAWVKPQRCRHHARQTITKYASRRLTKCCYREIESCTWKFHKTHGWVSLRRIQFRTRLRITGLFIGFSMLNCFLFVSLFPS